MNMEQTECSETSAYKIQTQGNYPEENIQQSYGVMQVKLVFYFINCNGKCIMHNILILLSSISPLCRVSTLIFLRKTMFLGKTVLQLF